MTVRMMLGFGGGDEFSGIAQPFGPEHVDPGFSRRQRDLGLHIQYLIGVSSISAMGIFFKYQKMTLDMIFSYRVAGRSVSVTVVCQSPQFILFLVSPLKNIIK